MSASLNRPLSIDGILPPPTRTIAERTPTGLRLKPRSQPTFQSRRERQQADEPKPAAPVTTQSSVAVAAKSPLLSRPAWLPAAVVLAGGIISVLYLPAGLAMIAGVALFELVTKRRSRPLFIAAFLLSFLIPIFSLFSLHKTIIAKNVATYLFALLSAALVVLVASKGKNHNKRL